MGTGFAEGMVDTASFHRLDGPGQGARDGEPARAAAFDDAIRHSRRVRFLRKAIPLGIMAAIGLAAFGRFFNPFRVIVPDVEVSSVGVSGSKLTMEQPKLSGFKKDNKAYEMVAATASQDIKQPNIVELTEPVARIEVQKGSWVRLTASKGTYDTTTEKLLASDKVTVKSDSGLDMRLTEAKVDFKTGHMTSDQPVEVDMPDGWVRSERMNVTDNGKVIVFEGRVRSEFRGAEQTGDAAKKETTPP
jgi:lipopolysaccharide export system protein LptC